MKVSFSKRLAAYILDIMIVTLVSSFITGLIPTNEKTNSLMENYYDLENGITEEKIDISDFYKEMNSINYELNREMVIQNIIIVTIYLLYFVVIPMYNNGQTVGKKVVRIRITSCSLDLNMNNMLIRSLILYGIARDIISIILILLLSKDKFINANIILNVVQVLINIVILFMIVFKNDGRGFHDILGKTKVIEEDKK